MTKRKRLSKINRKKQSQHVKIKPETGKNIWLPVILLCIVVISTIFFNDIKPLFSSSHKLTLLQTAKPESEPAIKVSAKPVENIKTDSSLLKKNQIDTAAFKPKDNVKTETSKKSSTPKKSKKIEKPKPKPKVTCQILNGCGTKGIATKFKSHLENKGHSVKSTSNYKSFKVKKSFIISQKKNDDPYILAKALNIPKSRIQIRKVKSSSNLIFVIGKDYKSLPPFKK